MNQTILDRPTTLSKLQMQCKELDIAIVGATGAVGRTLLELFNERNLTFKSISLVASSRSAGNVIDINNNPHTVSDIEETDFSRIKVAFCSAGSNTSRAWGRKIASQGPLVIDNSNAFRMDADVQLIVPQVNGDLLCEKPDSGIIANPNCTTIPLTRAIQPINDEFGLKRMVVSTYQAASGGGVAGLQEFREGTQELLDDSNTRLKSNRFPIPLPFNLIPNIDVMLDDGFTLEERKIAQESRKIMRIPDLQVTVTAVRVPVINCHSEAIYFECENPLHLGKMVQLLETGDELCLHNGPGEKGYPTPRVVSDRNEVHIGRLRVDPDNKNGGWMWIVSDNLRVGAALNALQIFETLLHRCEL